MITRVGLGGSSNRSVFDRPISQKQKPDVTLSAFGYLYCAMFDYCKGRSSNRTEIGTRCVLFVYSFFICITQIHTLDWKV